MIHLVDFSVFGTPIPKRMRTDRHTLKRYLHPDSRAYMAKVNAEARFAVRWDREGKTISKRAVPWPTPEDCARCRPTRRAGKRTRCSCPWCASSVRMDVRIYFPDRRVRDRDNVLKGIQDACKGVLYRDDTQVEDGELSKRLDRANPRVEIVVRLTPPAQAGLSLEEPTLELVQCSECEGTGGFDVVLPVSGTAKRVVCGNCAGSGEANP